MTLSCKTIVDRRDHVNYLTVSKRYLDDCICSLIEHNIAKKKHLCYGAMIIYIAHN